MTCADPDVVAAASTPLPSSRHSQRHRRSRVGRFVLGFIVAIVLVIFIVAQCVGALF